MFLATIQEIESTISEGPSLAASDACPGAPQNIEVVTLYNMTEQREQAKKQFQSEIIYQLALERKNKNYNELKQWDQLRSVRLTLHRKTIQQLVNRIEQKLRNSEDYFRVLQRFFADKAEQYKKYGGHLLSNPSLQGQINLLSSKLYNSTNSVIDHCHESSVALQKKYKEMADNIQNSVVQVMQHITNQMELELTVMRERFSALTGELQNTNYELSEEGAILASEFHKTKNSFSAGIDFYIEEQNFVKKACQQTTIQKKMAKEVLGYLDYAITSELARSIQLRNLVEAYTSIVEDHYQKNIRNEAKMKAKEDQQIQITKFFQFNELIDSTLEQHIKQALGLNQQEPMHLLQLRAYLNSLQFQWFDCESLVLKEFQAYHKHQNDFSPITVVVTVDGFMHLYERSKRQENFKLKNQIKVPQFVFKLHSGARLKSISQIQVEIQSTNSQSMIEYLARIPAKEGGFAFNVYFLTEKQKNEFVEYMGKIIN